MGHDHDTFIHGAHSESIKRGSRHSNANLRQKPTRFLLNLTTSVVPPQTDTSTSWRTNYTHTYEHTCAVYNAELYSELSVLFAFSGLAEPYRLLDAMESRGMVRFVLLITRLDEPCRCVFQLGSCQFREIKVAIMYMAADM